MPEEIRKSKIVKVNQVKKGFQAMITVVDKNGNAREQPLGEPLLSSKLKAELAKKGTAMVNREVVYKYRDGKVDFVFLLDEPGAPKVTPSTPQVTPPTTSASTSRPAQSPSAKQVFENPYNFIPAPARATDHPDLGDHPPRGHQAYFPGTWSGKIKVLLTAVTPLLVPEAASAEVDKRNQHRTLAPALDQNGMPIIPPTSLKGMLRAAYEAVTNSRMGVFAGHDERLAFRSKAQGGAQVVPFRVSDDGQFLELYQGTASQRSPEGRPIMSAAWIPRYKEQDKFLQEGLRLVEHGRHVWAELELWDHGSFSYWRVIALQPDSNQPPQQIHPRSDVSEGSRSRPSAAPHRWERGYVVVTKKNIGKKHDERFFFSVSEPPTIKLETEHQKLWSELVKNYQETHRQEIQRGQTGPSSMSGTVWSRHITGGRQETELTAGTLGYAKLDGARVVALYPVMISRQLFPNSPAALLHPSLEPAQRLEQLSPAERVFGWVNQNGEGSWRGALRLGPVQCQSAPQDALENFSSPVTLAILGAPKPEQVNFYLARDQNGTPLSGDKAKGYQSTQALRGRKVYPHQCLTEGKSYWDSRTTNSLQNGATQFYREYLRVDSLKDSQNRSISGWIKPGAQFEFSLEIENLSSCELGALLWLLCLEGQYYHRFGGGKPLGFGSVKLEVLGLEVADGEAIRDDYLNWAGGSSGRRWNSCAQAQAAVAEFQKAVSQAYGADFEEVPFIKAFLNAARGSSLPFHYPRPEQVPSSQPENFKWFMANEKQGGKPLPALTEDERGLPYQGG